MCLYKPQFYRCDGRSPEELRNISCQIDLYKPLHGSSLFQRGQTQVFCTVALDSPDSAMKMDPVTMLTRYTFFSTVYIKMKSG